MKFSTGHDSELETRPHVRRPDDIEFAFPPDSMLWRVCRERCTLLDGGVAAVLQVAHPNVAAGVRDHSDFRRDAPGRLRRTLDGVLTIAFGTRAEAAAAAARIAARHRHVRGRVAPPGSAACEERCNDQYAADDPELLMWVIATLVVAGINGYERALPRLSDAERASFYADMRRFGAYFGLPSDAGPQTWDEFQRYYDGMIADERMGSAAVSAAMARAVAAPARPWWLRLVGRPLRFAFVEILPSPVRERLGFRRTPWTSATMAVVRRLLPWLVPILPARLRYVPQYLAARKRMAQLSSRQSKCRAPAGGDAARSQGRGVGPAAILRPCTTAPHRDGPLSAPCSGARRS